MHNCTVFMDCSPIVGPMSNSAKANCAMSNDIASMRYTKSVCRNEEVNCGLLLTSKDDRQTVVLFFN